MINDKCQPNGEYYSQLRIPLLSLIKGTPKHVLEVGCAGGQTLAYLKDRGAEFAVGIECSPDVADIARKRGVDQVIVGDIESLDLGFPEESFDLIVAGHVLEHLADPWKVLRKLRTLLRTGGQIVGALPNVRHHSVVLPLLVSGTWQYEESGIMDWTHLRFFTKQSLLDMLEKSGLQVESIVPELAGPKSRLANALTCNIFRNFLSYAYNFSAFKVTSNTDN